MGSPLADIRPLAATWFVATLLLAGGCNYDLNNREGWDFIEPDAGLEAPDPDVSLPDGGCMVGEERQLAGGCGYENRGETWLVCVGGRWQSRCRNVWFNNCRELNEAHPNAESGEYEMDPGGPEDDTIETFRAQCNMEKAGGGWMKIEPCMARDILKGQMVEVHPTAENGYDDSCRPFSMDARNDAANVYHYTFTIPGGFREFFLQDYVAKARSGENTSELGYEQQDWRFPEDYCPGSPPPGRDVNYGDISFGGSENAGPTTSFSRVVSEAPNEPMCQNCTIDWTENGTVYSVDRLDPGFRIGWGECGTQTEGWFPWWQGSVWVR